ncbi:MAG: DMT family transporter [Planctomycetota bacterium]|nr:DMT family transporter [Planctomycetota bacterium]
MKSKPPTESRRSISQRLASASGAAWRGPLYMVLSALFFSLTALFVKELKPRYDFFEIVFVRSLFGLVLVTFYIIQSNASFWGNRKGVLIARGLFGFVGLMCYFFAVQNMASLSDAIMLLHTNPIFVALLAPFILKEKASPVRYMLIAFAFIGALMIIKPSFELSSLYSLVGLCAGMAAAVAYVFIRKATLTESAATIMFYFPFISVILTLPLLVNKYTGDSAAMNFSTDYRDIGMLVAIGVLGTVAQLFLTVGFKLVPASRATIYNYTAPVFAVCFELFLYSRVPGMLSVTGSVIIVVCAGVIAVMRERKSTGT